MTYDLLTQYAHASSALPHQKSPTYHTPPPYASITS
jgi:hypothetical protein